jgi:hypothetical protein
MKRLRQLQAGVAEDHGAALLLVLIIVTVVSLGGAALLSFSDASIRTTVALRDQAGNAYNADGAARVAINALGTGYGFTSPALFDNGYNTTCFGANTTSGTLNLPDFYPATSGNGTAPGSASVDCSADPATGVNGTVVPITSANRPGQAILTLGPSTLAQSAEDGINIKALSGNPFSVKGAVESNSNINVVSGTLQSTAAVTASRACSGTILATPAKTCNTNTSVADPNYASEASFGSPANAVPKYQAVPADIAASCPSGVVTFNPGYYDDAISLTALMTGSGPCGGSTWWFKPGTYYFDFHNNTNDSDVYLGSGTGNNSSADQWAITRGHLVAGTPTDSSGNPIASPGPSPTFPGSCQNPIKSASALGVQFIFGGDSQLALSGSADGEICGTYNATRPPIGVFGLKSGAATTTIAAWPGSGVGAPLKMSSPTSAGKFTNPTNVIEQDGSSATWVKSTVVPETSTITVSGYAPPTVIPAGSIVKAATVRVTHGNTGKYVAPDKLTLTFTPKGVAGSPPASAITLTPTLPNNTSLVTDSLDIYAGGTSVFDKFVHDHGYTSAAMAYAATLTHKGTENLDSIQIDITYVTPAFRSEGITTIGSNCMRQAYTGGSGAGCAVLSTSALASFSGAFYVQGTTYTPIAAIDLTLNSATQPVLRFGAISRSLWVTETGPFSYSAPVVAIPDDTTGSNSAPIVYLTVYVCPATTTSSCLTDPGAITALRVKARVNSVPPLMTILSWSNLR